MGAINFIGGSWTGGGYGYLVNPELREFCSKCECFSDMCDDFKNHSADFESETDNDSIDFLHKEISNNIDEISEYVISLIKDVTFTWNTAHHGKRTYRLETISKGLEKYSNGNILEIHHGYYDGFQIIANKDYLENKWRHTYGHGYHGWYTYEDSYLPDNIVKGIYKLINDTLADEKFNIWAWEK